MDTEKKRLFATFHGHVQGVGFRYTVTEIAWKFQITGQVRNCADGSVEVIAEGKEHVLPSFLSAILASHVGRYVMHHTAHYLQAQNTFSEFSIAR